VTDYLSNQAKHSSWDMDPFEHSLRLYTEFTKDLFRHLDQTAWESWAYRDDAELTRINIGSTTPMDSSQVAARPAIIVESQGCDSSQGIIGDLDDMDPFTGKVTYIELFTGTLLAYTLSKVPAEARKIAWFLKEMTWALRTTLVGNAAFYQIGRGIRQSPVLEPGSLVGGDLRGAIKAVALAIPFSFIRRTSVTPINKPKLNRIDIHIRPGQRLVVDPPLASDWTVERWIASQNAGRGYLPPTDPANVPPPLPTEAGPGGQSGGEVIVRVDLTK
jgi:hypothetical protein